MDRMSGRRSRINIVNVIAKIANTTYGAECSCTGSSYPIMQILGRDATSMYRITIQKQPCRLFSRHVTLAVETSVVHTFDCIFFHSVFLSQLVCPRR
jgi:hypothetical protein